MIEFLYKVDTNKLFKIRKKLSDLGLKIVIGICVAFLIYMAIGHFFLGGTFLDNIGEGVIVVMIILSPVLGTMYLTFLVEWIIKRVEYAAYELQEEKKKSDIIISETIQKIAIAESAHWGGFEDEKLEEFKY